MGATGHINVKSFRFNLFQENSYVLWNEGGDCVLVDPGCYSPKESSALKAFITDNGLNPKAIWLTHGHFDHIFGVAEMSREYSLPVWMSPEDRFILDVYRCPSVDPQFPTRVFPFSSSITGATSTYIHPPGRSVTV